VTHLFFFVFGVIDRVGLLLDGARHRLGRCLRVDLHEHGQRKVGLEILEDGLRGVLQELDKLDAYEAGHHGRRRGQRGDDAACNQACLQLVHLHACATTSDSYAR